MTLADAARQLGTDPGNLSRIENGRQHPSVALARRMAAFYGMSLDDVFTPEQPPAKGHRAEAA
jgi:transcriptional regulator with XRE-family HTH domain